MKKSRKSSTGAGLAAIYIAQIPWKELISTCNQSRLAVDDREFQGDRFVPLGHSFLFISETEESISIHSESLRNKIE